MLFAYAISMLPKQCVKPTRAMSALGFVDRVPCERGEKLSNVTDSRLNFVTFSAA